MLNDFYLACDKGLQYKLGCVLFQFPPSMVYSSEKLELITGFLNYSFTNAIEFRHKSWWSKKVYDVLKAKVKNCKTAFVYFNNTAGNAGILNAQEFKKLK